MPIRVSCGCGKQLQVPDTAVGKIVRCPGCKGVVTLPPNLPPPPEAAERAPRPAPAPDPEVAEKPRPSKSSPRLEDTPSKRAKEREPEEDRFDDEPEEAPRKKRARRSEEDRDDERDDEQDEPSPRRKKSRRDDDSDDDAPAKKPRKKKPLWAILLAVGCGGLLLLSCAGVGVFGGFLYYLNSQQDKVAGKWVVDPNAPENATLSPLHRATQMEFDKQDQRCSMRVFGVEFIGKWRVIRNRENDAILVLVDFEDARGPDGKKLDMKGKEKFQSAFEITPIDADHIDFVDVKERAVRVRMKKVDAFEKASGKS